MLLAFASSCCSGRTSSLWYMLHHGFIDQGVMAYMGYLNDVSDLHAFRFADRFYHWVSQGITVFQSMNRAQVEVPQVQGNIVLYGNQGLRLVD